MDRLQTCPTVFLETRAWRLMHAGKGLRCPGECLNLRLLGLPLFCGDLDQPIMLCSIDSIGVLRSVIDSAIASEPILGWACR